VAIDLQVTLDPAGAPVQRATLSRPGFRDMYWTFAQQLAHLTSNGVSTRPGDLLGSGTVSGPERDQFGSLLELTWGGKEAITLPGGSELTYLRDGDTVILEGWCTAADGHRVELSPAAGRVAPAID
jgi:fumarylacetoacetase